MSQSVEEHRRTAPRAVSLGVVTVSDTRSLGSDESGDLIVAMCEEAGHRVVERALVPDDPGVIASLLQDWSRMEGVEAILVTGGTGISPRDQTYEAVAGILTRELPGFGELFRFLSYAAIGPACILSRAIGGLIGERVILAMPGSRAAVELAMSKIILPELPHLVREATKRLPPGV
jgi:molybdenum cofactor biosynthesis protein B